MRAYTVLPLIMVLVFSPVQASPTSEAMAVLERWTQAFTDSDIDGIVRLYANDALFLGTGSKVVVSDTNGIRAYFENALFNDTPRSATLDTYSAVEVSASVVVFSGLDRVTGYRGGKQFTSRGRVTIVVAKRRDEWKIVQFHRSALPE